jgi:hypothetical protein
MALHEPGFSSFVDVLEDGDVEKLIEECKTLFSAQSKEKDSRYSAGQTYWYDCRQETYLAIESFGKKVFEDATKNLSFDSAKSGIEYWPLVMEGCDDVGAHYDKDYGAEDEGKKKKKKRKKKLKFSFIRGRSLSSIGYSDVSDPCPGRSDIVF